ncbi:MAG: succinylglutamate desuccinylase/aspartoacylase family protein [bacterium]
MQDPTIITIDSGKSGKTLTIMAGVHGNEICGPMALRQLIAMFNDNKLQLLSGKLRLIFANLAAMAIGERQTQMNMNRAFRPQSMLTNNEDSSYERQRAAQLMPYLAESDALLDIHSSMTEKSKPFIICEPHSFSVTQRLPFLICSHGWDRIEPGGTDYFVNKSGGIGICIECGYHLDPEAPGRAFDSALIFLKFFGAIEGEDPKINSSQKIIHAYDLYFSKVDFQRAESFDDFQQLKAGDLIGTDGGKEVRATDDFLIIFPNDCKTSGEEAFILGKFV